MASPDTVSIARELGVCEPGKPGSLALLGPGDHAAPYPSCRAKPCNHKANRVAYFSSHLFDTASIYRRRAEDHARAAAPLDNSRDTRHLHAGSHNQKNAMRRRRWSRSCSEKKQRKHKLCLDRVHSLYPFCAFLCPRENGARPASA
jgi:hypothetical protein